MSGSGPVDGLAAYVEGDTIAARLTGRGTHTGTFSGIAPTGRSITTQEVVVHRVADGRIVRCWGDLFPVVRDALTTPAAG